MAASSVETRPEAPLDREAFVSKRLKFIDYMRRAHDGEVFWMNTARLDHRDVCAAIEPAELIDRCGDCVVFMFQLWFACDCVSKRVLSGNSATLTTCVLAVLLAAVIGAAVVPPVWCVWGY